MSTESIEIIENMPKIVNVAFKSITEKKKTNANATISDKLDHYEFNS